MRKSLFFQAVKRNIQKKLINTSTRCALAQLRVEETSTQEAKALEEGEILWGSSEMGQPLKLATWGKTI